MSLANSVLALNYFCMLHPILHVNILTVGQFKFKISKSVNFQAGQGYFKQGYLKTKFISMAALVEAIVFHVLPCPVMFCHVLVFGSRV